MGEGAVEADLADDDKLDGGEPEGAAEGEGGGEGEEECREERGGGELGDGSGEDEEVEECAGDGDRNGAQARPAGGGDGIAGGFGTATREGGGGFEVEDRRDDGGEREE